MKYGAVRKFSQKKISEIRERVMRNAFKLKNTDFTIYDDIPKELIDLRKKHMTIFREARKAGKKAVYSKSEPDKLFINGKLVA